MSNGNRAARCCSRRGSVVILERALQSRLRRALHSRPALIWLAPTLLTLVFCLAAGFARALTPPLAMLALAYTSAPVVCAYVQGPLIKPSQAKKPSALDFLAILLLWLPLEFGAGASLIPRPAQGFLHSVAYGISILLGLVVFLLFRSFAGMKYNLPQRAPDFWFPVVAYVVLAKHRASALPHCCICW